MSAVIIFLSSGLLVYWLMRSWLLAVGPEEAVVVVLEADYWWGRRVWIAVRTMMWPIAEMSA